MRDGIGEIPASGRDDSVVLAERKRGMNRRYFIRLMCLVQVTPTVAPGPTLAW
jgi:hypothetical protein